MALVKLVVEKRNSSGVVQSRTPIKIINSIVSRQGSRAVDTGENSRYQSSMTWQKMTR